MDMIDTEETMDPLDGAETPAGDSKAIERDENLVRKILARVKADKRHHKKAFDRMKRDMFIATNGRSPGWHEDNYCANIAGRHVKQKTASLYAKNPKATARRRETLDFAVWDENPESLMAAFQNMQMAQV